MEIKRKNTLLVVEDAVDLQGLTKEILESEGYDVYCANNGKEALDFLQRNPVKLDLILLDLMMPVMDGYHFRRAQLSDSRISSIPVVVLTADGSARASAEQLGTKGFYDKADGIDELLEVVKRCVGGVNPGS